MNIQERACRITWGFLQKCQNCSFNHSALFDQNCSFCSSRISTPVIKSHALLSTRPYAALNSKRDAGTARRMPGQQKRCRDSRRGAGTAETGPERQRRVLRGKERSWAQRTLLGYNMGLLGYTRAWWEDPISRRWYPTYRTVGVPPATPAVHARVLSLLRHLTCRTDDTYSPLFVRHSVLYSGNVKPHLADQTSRKDQNLPKE